jgi:D-alanyl-D-alanine carboxypeptidase/D-alanyl-D-alanine-endopeptidase (penicillin-binding protein 4)
LSKQENFESLKENMATPGKGTLSNRMLYFHDNLRAKTGTLSNVSSIAGYIKTQKGRNLAFDIVINDPKSQSNNKKQLEEMILRAIYMNY